ncbi:MAG: hypothetical protein Kow0090_09510 [Myxococcota bacterium]
MKDVKGLKNFIALFFVMLSTAAFAAGGGESPEPNIIQLVGLTLNVIVLFGIVIYFAKGPLGKMLVERRREAEDALKETDRIREEAVKKLSEYTEKLSALKDETARLEGEFRNAAELERERILSEAKKQSERLLKETEFAIEQEFRKVKRELVERTAGMALDIAMRIVRENINEEDRKKLTEEYINELNKVPLQ